MQARSFALLQLQRDDACVRVHALDQAEGHRVPQLAADCGDPRFGPKTNFWSQARVISRQKQDLDPRRSSFWAKNEFLVSGGGHFTPKTGFRPAATLVLWYPGRGGLCRGREVWPGTCGAYAVAPLHGYPANLAGVPDAPRCVALPAARWSCIDIVMPFFLVVIPRYRVPPYSCLLQSLSSSGCSRRGAGSAPRRRLRTCPPRARR